MKIKICSKCKLEKPIEEFAKDRARKDGLYPSCDTCRRKATGIAGSTRRHKLSPDERKKKQTDYYSDRKFHILEQQKLYRAAHKDILNAANKNWYATSGKEYYAERYVNDLSYRLARVLRARLYTAIKNNQKVGSAVRDLGCSLDEFKIYMAALFLPGMSWDNWTKDGWHIDHIVPLSSAKTPQELIVLCHYSNLQPLWAHDNLVKGSK